MPVPQVAIVGRPNVGKSSLFNALAGKRIAITDAQAGVTRDRVMHLLNVEDRFFELVDTGGMGFDDPDKLSPMVEAQIQNALESAALILFVVDTQAGIVAHDQEIAARLRRLPAPVLLVANKTDHAHHETIADEFHHLGFADVLKVSAKVKRGFDELFEAVVAHLPDYDPDESEVEDPVMKLAIVGRRNTGKSTFINSLAQSERMIVSEVPGTTRDSVDVRFEMDHRPFVAIDTPGLRQRKSVQTNVDYYGLQRAQLSIRRADVTFLFFDAAVEIGRVDKQLADYIHEQHKPCIFVVNKWDLYAGKVATEDWAQYLRDEFPAMWHVPIAFVTGQTGRNVKMLVNHGQMLFKQARTRVPTAELNRLIRAAMLRNPPHRTGKKIGKIFYAAQIGIQPPTIVFVCNNPESFSANYRKYLMGVLHDQLEFGEVPIQIFFRTRAQNDKEVVSQAPADVVWDDDEDSPVPARNR